MSKTIFVQRTSALRRQKIINILEKSAFHLIPGLYKEQALYRAETKETLNSSVQPYLSDRVDSFVLSSVVLVTLSLLSSAVSPNSLGIIWSEALH